MAKNEIARGNLAQEYLCSILRYDYLTGDLWWKVAGRGRDATKPAGFVRKYPDGYRTKGIRVNYTQYSQCQIILLMVRGINSPTGYEIDHIDGNSMNNRIENLRVVPARLNRQNLHTATRKSKTGFLGVVKNKSCVTRPYRAQITNCVEGADGRLVYKKIHLGMYATPEAAHQAYLEAKRRLHPGCTL